jgi:hypothetical protein
MIITLLYMSIVGAEAQPVICILGQEPVFRSVSAESLLPQTSSYAKSYACFTEDVLI